MFRHLKVKYLNTSLKRKIVILITLFVTVIPTTLIAILAFTYYKLGIESLFNEQISNSINETVEIAQQYLKEHKDNIRADILSIAKGIDLNYTNLVDDPDLFATYLDKQAEFRNLAEIVVFQHNRIISKNTFSFSFAFEKIPESELQKADNGDVVILDSSNNDKVQAILKLNNFVHTYMLVGMYVDQSIINYLRNSKGSADQYQHLINDLKSTQIKLEIAFVMAFVALCSLAIIFGIRLSSVITSPLKNLVDATEKLKEGDFTIKLIEKPGRDETAVLTRAFNRMTETLASQRNELIKANNLINERRRFIEKVLSEISAGVISLNSSKEITLINYSASGLLGLNSKPGKKTVIDSIFPEIKHLLVQSTNTLEEVIGDNLKIIRNYKSMHLFVRISCLINKDSEQIESFIITFDDITELVSAQRNAAWSDIARRIAHEIKNPLTPINLAAERLKAKFTKEISSDQAGFEKYINTIIRHVQDIGSIVEEFVQFARIPAPKLKKNNLVKIIHDAIFSQQVAFKNVSFIFNTPLDKCYVDCDAMQISQILTNILKNASESIEAKLKNAKPDYVGQINITLKSGKQVKITISDNGAGIDSSILDKVFEPYVTTKSHGTGVGLAIVKKIIEDHNGAIAIKPNKKEGVIVEFTLPTYNTKAKP